MIIVGSIRAYDSALVSFGTRNMYSDTLSTTRGIGAARRWIHAQLSQFSRNCGGCLRVQYDTGTMQTPRNRASPQHVITNVTAWLPGRDTTRVIVIGGHYDSCVCAVGDSGRGRFDSLSTAAGANDDHHALPSRTGPWPETKRRLPVRTAPT